MRAVMASDSETELLAALADLAGVDFGTIEADFTGAAGSGAAAGMMASGTGAAAGGGATGALTAGAAATICLCGDEAF